MFIVQDPQPPPVAALFKSLDSFYRTLTAPSVEELLVPRCVPFVYDVSFEAGRLAPLTVMHTSGSTGLPKPITWNQEFVARFGRQWELQPPQGYDSTDHFYNGNRIFVMFPPFHVSTNCHDITKY